MWRRTRAGQVAAAVDPPTARHSGYAVSQKKRKRLEECFGWLKDIPLLRKLNHRGLFKVAWIFNFGAASYNVDRDPNIGNLYPISSPLERFGLVWHRITGQPERDAQCLDESAGHHNFGQIDERPQTVPLCDIFVRAAGARRSEEA